jgi:uncharacterized protein
MSQKPEKIKTCCDAPPGQVLLGIRQFNNAEWFECHETFELLWIGAVGDVRNLYQGIIQLAVALHHWRNGNLVGATSLLESGVGYLSKVPQACLWIDVKGLILQADRMREALLMVGQGRMVELDRSVLPEIKTVSI